MIPFFRLHSRLKSINSLAALLGLLLSHTLAGQDITVSPVTFPEGRRLSMIVEMAQDTNGYIWMAADVDGLVRYDGDDLKSFKPKREVSSDPIRLECIEISRDGTIWIGDFTAGLYSFNPELERFVRYTHDKNNGFSLRHNAIRVIHEDTNGTLWIGTLQGIDTLDRQTGKFHHLDESTDILNRLSREHIREIYEDRQGNLWFGCSSPLPGDDTESGLGGLYKFDKSTNEISLYVHDVTDPTTLIDNHVSALFEDSQGTFWVGTAGDGLHTMDRGQGTFTRHMRDPDDPPKLSRPETTNPDDPTDHITFINEDASGQIWIGTFFSGLNRYDPHTKSVRFYGPGENDPNKIGRMDHWSSLRTSDGTLWISSAWITGDTDLRLSKIVRNLPGIKYEMLGNVAISFHEDSDGILWIGTDRDLVRRNVDGSHDTFQVNPDLASLDGVAYIEEGPSNTLLLSTNTGLYSFDKSDKIFFKYDSTHEFGVVSKYNEDGTIWYGTWISFDLLDTESDEVTHFHNATGDSTRLRNLYSVHSILVEDNGELWVTGTGGVYRFNHNQTEIRSFFENQFFRNIIRDQRDNLWVSSINGLFRYNSNRDDFIRYTDSTMILSDNSAINYLVEDDNGLLWAHRNPGLVRINPIANNATFFGLSWLPTETSLIDRMIYTTSKGEIIIGDETGYFALRPEEMVDQAYDPSPFIEKLFVSDDQIELALASHKGLDPLKIELGSDQNNLSIEFGNIDFQSKGLESNLTYKLQNRDVEWQRARNLEKASYYNLNPGTYLFRVRASNLYGRIGETSLIIEIRPPWYLTTWAFVLYGIVFVAGAYSVHRIQKARTIRKEHERIREKELQQAREIEKAYAELKNTQAQLIQSEKMASLGELTAGIAHEIQNPLNFVNNFSDVNKELAEELMEEIKKGNGQEAEAILKDIIDNEEKILHHGKRADGIVKGMLQHSRKGGGEKEPTDINELADEYLRLSYHGLRAKDKSFNADFKTELDPDLPNINVVPQDIGRVLLNLINNAFFAVSARATGEKDFKPEVVVSTKRVDSPLGERGGTGGVQISIKDNGPGIPEDIKDKIFQPFFTTKSTGEGTGLGLSLSYDIVTKGHGGELLVESKKGQDTEFTVVLPING